MTIDATKPLDSELVSVLPSWIRNTRSAVNAISAGGGVSAQEIDIAALTTELTIGNELDDVGIETLVVTGLGAATLTNIYGGTNGQIKIFIFQDANVKMNDGNTKTLGDFYLNQLPAGADYEPQADYIIALCNIGGDGGATTHGYWKELFRTDSVK